MASKKRRINTETTAKTVDTNASTDAKDVKTQSDSDGEDRKNIKFFSKVVSATTIAAAAAATAKADSDEAAAPRVQSYVHKNAGRIMSGITVTLSPPMPSEKTQWVLLSIPKGHQYPARPDGKSIRITHSFRERLSEDCTTTEYVVDKGKTCYIYQKYPFEWSVSVTSKDGTAAFIFDKDKGGLVDDQGLTMLKYVREQEARALSMYNDPRCYGDLTLMALCMQDCLEHHLATDSDTYVEFRMMWNQYWATKTETGKMAILNDQPLFAELMLKFTARYFKP